MADLFDDWTRDQAGKHVDWTKRPYYVKGVLNVVLPHERELSHEEISKRIGEYMKLTWRQLKGKNEDAPRAQTQRGVGKTQRDLWSL